MTEEKRSSGQDEALTDKESLLPQKPSEERAKPSMNWLGFLSRLVVASILSFLAFPFMENIAWSLRDLLVKPSSPSFQTSAPFVQPSTTAEQVPEVKPFLIENNIASPEDFRNINSPQAQALKFLESTDLSDEENYRYDIKTAYALAVLYYATGPWDTDLNFLASFHYCQWYKILENSDMSQEFKGVACDEKSQVRAVFLSNITMKGQLPTELTLLTSLLAIDVNTNKLTGTIPDGLATLPDLENFFVGGNRLTGTVPPTWTSSIKNINLANNSFVGRVDWDGASMPELKGVALNHNQLTGDITLFSAEAFPKLEQLYLGHNHFTGPLREDTFAMDLLEYLDVSRNQLSGSLPDHLFAPERALKVLTLQGNSFTGLLPQVMEENTKLEMLTLSDCKLDKQPIPSAISNLRGLKHLDLTGNDFTGTIPSQLAELTQLEKLFLAKNGFDEMDLESWLPKLTTLKEVSLKSTGATGSIPDLSNLTSLVLLDLDDNQLTGSIPSTLGALNKLRFLLVNRNKLRGEIPSSLLELSNLDLVFVENNAVPLGPICDSPVAKKGAMIVGDCDACRCCALCCVQLQQCNENIKVPNYDPDWQADLQRKQFSFGPSANFPAPAEVPDEP